MLRPRNDAMNFSSDFQLLTANSLMNKVKNIEWWLEKKLLHRLLGIPGQEYQYVHKYCRYINRLNNINDN